MGEGCSGPQDGKRPFHLRPAGRQRVLNRTTSSSSFVTPRARRPRSPTYVPRHTAGRGGTPRRARRSEGFAMPACLGRSRVRAAPLRSVPSPGQCLVLALPLKTRLTAAAMATPHAAARLTPIPATSPPAPCSAPPPPTRTGRSSSGCGCCRGPPQGPRSCQVPLIVLGAQQGQQFAAVTSAGSSRPTRSTS